MKYEILKLLRAVILVSAMPNHCRSKQKFVKDLNIVSEVLDTILPTSMESERAFSATVLFITKIRSRLAGDTLDSLFFLRNISRIKRIRIICHT